MNPQFVEKELKAGGRLIIETLYNGIHVFMDKETGYYYAGSICRVNGKKMKHLLENQDYELMKTAISASAGIPADELELEFERMPNDFRGTWIHPLLVNTVCEWANKNYAVLVSMLMNEKAKQALIEKKTLQEQVEDERERTERLQEKLERSSILIKEKDEALKRSKHKNKSLEQKMNELVEDSKRKDEKLDELMSAYWQSDGKLDDANNKIDELLLYARARDKDCSLIKTKMNVLNNKVSNLNGSNYDDEGTVVFIWTLFRSESMRISYTKQTPANAIWIYSQIREDKNIDLPADAEILFEANVVSRSMYETLVRELKPMTIDSFYRHILISYENAIAFIERLNELLDARGIHPETYNIETLSNEIETLKAKDEIKHKREARIATQTAIRQRIIDSGLFYIYIFGRWRRLYCTDENNELTTTLVANRFFYVRTGTGGVNNVHVQTTTLVNADFRSYGDTRIRYE